MRTGRFRIQAASFPQRLLEAKRLAPQIQKLSKTVSSPARLTYEVLKLFWEMRWGQIRRARIQKPLLPIYGGEPWVEDLNNFSWQGLSVQINRSLCRWGTGDLRYILTSKIPSASEMLQAQCEGRRYVSLLKSEEDLKILHEEKFDAVGLLLHDLQHAERFFADCETYQTQIGFYRLFRQFLARPEGKILRAENPKLVDYLASDMNTHPMHQLLFLFGILHRWQGHLDTKEQIWKWWRERIWQSTSATEGWEEMLKFKRQAHAGDWNHLKGVLTAGSFGTETISTGNAASF